MDCIYCTTPLPDKAFFCPNCSKQNKCKHCSEVLVPEAKVCIYCGETIGQKSPSNGNFNTIEFSESETSRTFKATFTDTVGQSISDSFGLIIANKVGSKKNQQTALNASNLTDKEKTEDVGAVVIDDESPDIDKLKSILKDDGEKVTLSETRLKAKSKLDYGKRLATIFLYYKSLKGVDSVPRKSLNAILQDASVEDGNFRHWLANNPLIGVSNDSVLIKAPGKDLAKKVIADVFNPELKDKWQIGTTSKSGRKSKGKKSAEK